MSTERTNEIEEAASEWLIRRDSGLWTEDDQARFDEWLNASTLHRVAFLRLELAWEESARLKALGAGIHTDQPPPQGSWSFWLAQNPGDASWTSAQAGERAASRTAGSNSEQQHGSAQSSLSSLEERQGANAAGRVRFPREGLRMRILAIAASVLLAITASLATYHYWPSSGDRYTTPIGGIASVPMLDGSKVTLNTDSRVQIALTETERHVDLKQGEAFFEVAKDPNRPFIVQAGTKRIIAIGTKFSVRRDADNSVEVIVTEGKVRIESGASSRSPETPDPGTLLMPGAIARANDAGVLIERKSLPEAETHLSWRIGVLMFREQTLESAAAEFNRYNIRKIVIADPAVANLKVEGNFRATNVDAFVRLLESGFPVQASIEDNRIILSSR